MTENVETINFLETIVKAIDEKNGHDILAFDRRGQSILSDFNIVVSGHSNRQMLAIAQAIVQAAEEEGKEASIEGKSGARWVLVDLGDIIVHIFEPEARDLYQLENLWIDSELVDLSDWLVE